MSNYWISYNKISLKISEMGRPFYQNLNKLNNNLDFNISHDNEYVVLGSVLDGKIGIDILNIERNFNYNDLINFFTEEEKLYINNSGNKNKALCKIWSIKESFVKNTGTGLKYNPKKYSVTIANDNIIFKENNNIIHDYSFKIFDYDDYIISVCISEKDYDFTRLNFFEMSAIHFCNLLFT